MMYNPQVPMMPYSGQMHPQHMAYAQQPMQLSSPPTHSIPVQHMQMNPSQQHHQHHQQHQQQQHQHHQHHHQQQQQQQQQHQHLHHQQHQHQHQHQQPQQQQQQQQHQPQQQHHQQPQQQQPKKHQKPKQQKQPKQIEEEEEEEEEDVGHHVVQPQQLPYEQQPKSNQPQYTHEESEQEPDQEGGPHLIHKHHSKSNIIHPPQPMPPPVSDPPAPEDPQEGILQRRCRPGGAPSVDRPCLHNDWDDVRTRKGSKILRCRLCQRKWKLQSSTVARCASFLQNICPNGLQCAYLHVHKKKSHSTSLDMQMDEFMPPLASPEATPPASPNALLAALRDYVMRPAMGAPESPVQTDTSELVEMLRMAGLGCVSDPPTPASTTASNRGRSRHGSLKGEYADGSSLPPSPIHRRPHSAGQASSPSNKAASPGPGLAARRAFAKQAVAIPTSAAPVVKCITPSGVLFISPTAGPSGELVTGLSFEQIRDYVSGTPTSSKSVKAAAARRRMMGISPHANVSHLLSPAGTQPSPSEFTSGSPGISNTSLSPN